MPKEYPSTDEIDHYPDSYWLGKVEDNFPPMDDEPPPEPERPSSKPPKAKRARA